MLFALFLRRFVIRRVVEIGFVFGARFYAYFHKAFLLGHLYLFQCSPNWVCFALFNFFLRSLSSVATSREAIRSLC